MKNFVGYYPRTWMAISLSHVCAGWCLTNMKSVMRLRQALIVKYLGNRTRCTSLNACRGRAKYKDKPISTSHAVILQRRSIVKSNINSKRELTCWKYRYIIYLTRKSSKFGHQSVWRRMRDKWRMSFLNKDDQEPALFPSLEPELTRRTRSLLSWLCERVVSCEKGSCKKKVKKLIY